MKPNPASRRNAARLLLLAGLAAALPAAAQLFGSGQPEMLEPEKAFRISARALDERTAEVQFRIAKGYYMYRDRFSFATEAGEPLGEAEIPRGVVKQDPFFGNTETFRDLVRIRVPVSAQDMAKGSVNLKVTSQGCSDKGVCYVPLEQTVRVSLTSAHVAPSPDSTAASTRVPWLLLAASLAGGLALLWASAGAPLPGKRKARLSSPARALWSLVLGAAGVFAGWPGSQRGEFDRPVRAAALQAVALAVLAAAMWVGAPLLPDVFRMLAWAGWLIVAAILLRAIDPLPHNAHWLARLAKAAGVAMLVWGVAVALGALSGARDPLRPFEAIELRQRVIGYQPPERFLRVLDAVLAERPA